MAERDDHLMMGSRGVTRPMAEAAMKAKPGQGSNDARSPRSDDAHHEKLDDKHGMSHEDRLQQLHLHHKQTLWIYWTLVTLGIWLLVAPFAFGYLNRDLWVDPSGNRGPWFASESTQQLRELRAWLMTASDLICGALLLVFGWRSLLPNRPKSLWACCFVGVWLTFAPIVFWAPVAASYLNDSITGILIIALTILIPGMPNMVMYMQHGPPTPPGWTYNPSSWPQRWIMIATGFAGFIVSRYLAVYQLGYIDYVWDPFFGFVGGTQLVLDSDMSHRWPISDGGLGAASYTFEFLMGYMGAPTRWRTMPWMVAFFGILVIPLGLTHIILVVSQPVVVHAWCSLCLLAAIIMLPMIPLEVDEVVAMLQHLRQAKKRGDRGGSSWKIFWLGGQADDCTPDERSPQLMEMSSKPWQVLMASIWGMSFPWTLITCTVAGVALVYCPTWFGVDIKTTAADIGHLGGALIVTVSVISMGEVVRAGRYLNLLLAGIVAIGPWVVGYADTSYKLTSTGIAIAVFLLSLPRGRVRESYGTWDRYVR